MSIDCALFGTLTKDADRRVSKNGKDFVMLNVAVGNDNATQSVSVFVFGTAVDAVGALLKGAKVYCEGKIEVNTWTAQDGTTRAGLKVLSFKAEETHRIGRNRPKREHAGDSKAASQSENVAADAEPGLNDEIPF